MGIPKKRKRLIELVGSFPVLTFTFICLLAKVYLSGLWNLGLILRLGRWFHNYAPEGSVSTHLIEEIGYFLRAEVTAVWRHFLY